MKEPSRERTGYRSPEVVKGQSDSTSSLCCKGRTADVVGKEFPHITMSNNDQLTIIGCMRQWWIVYCKPIEDNKMLTFFLLESTSKIGTEKKFPLVVFTHGFSCFLDDVIKKKKCRCSDSLVSHDSASSWLCCSYCSFYVVFLNSLTNAVLLSLFLISGLLE